MSIRNLLIQRSKRLCNSGNALHKHPTIQQQQPQHGIPSSCTHTPRIQHDYERRRRLHTIPTIASSQSPPSNTSSTSTNNSSNNNNNNTSTSSPPLRPPPSIHTRPTTPAPVSAATTTTTAAATSTAHQLSKPSTTATSTDRSSGNHHGERNRTAADATLSDKELLQQIYDVSHQYIQDDNAQVRLQDLLDTPLLDEYAGGVIISEGWVERELLNRIAKQVFLCDTMPLGLSLMPSMAHLRDLYLRSYVELMTLLENYAEQNTQLALHGKILADEYRGVTGSSGGGDQMREPETLTTEHFVDMFSHIYHRHQQTLHLAAKGMNELKASLKGKIFRSEDVTLETIFFEELQSESTDGANDALQIHLDELCKTHIGLSMLLQHHVELFYQYNPISTSMAAKRSVQKHQQLLYGQSSSSYKGIVCTEMQSSQVLETAIDGAKEHVRLWYECQHGGEASVDHLMPKIRVNHVIAPEGETNEPTFAFVPQNLYYILYELLKNSLMATIETVHPWTSKSPKKVPEMHQIEVTLIQHASNEDMCVKITDRAAGIPRSKVDKIFRYMLTHESSEENASEFQDAVEATVAENNSGGLGMGLLSAKHFAEFFGGSLQVHSLESFGTDVYVYISTNNGDDQDQH